MKFFMWIVGQINNQKDQLFQICEVPLNQVIDIWQWNKNRVLQIDYAYIREICHSMSKKVYIEDFKLLDEKTMKQKNCFKIMPLFQWISYKDGESCVSYKLNDSLMEYLLDLKHNFTQIKFKDIQQMKSAYSIRIYTMLVSELKQNRQNLKISVAVLQNILEVPKSLLD